VVHQNLSKFKLVFSKLFQAQHDGISGGSSKPFKIQAGVLEIVSNMTRWKSHARY
jgi:hypothetical protein